MGAITMVVDRPVVGSIWGVQNPKRENLLTPKSECFEPHPVNHLQEPYFVAVPFGRFEGYSAPLPLTLFPSLHPRYGHGWWAGISL